MEPTFLWLCYVHWLLAKSLGRSRIVLTGLNANPLRVIVDKLHKKFRKGLWLLWLHLWGCKSYILPKKKILRAEKHCDPTCLLIALSSSPSSTGHTLASAHTQFHQAALLSSQSGRDHSSKSTYIYINSKD